MGYELNIRPAHHVKIRVPGYDFATVDNMLHNTINRLLGENAKVNFIAHDWGAIMAMLFETQRLQRIAKLVLMDVGLKNRMSIMDAVRLAVYQIWFAGAYIASQLFGRTIGNAISVGYGALITVAPFLSPLRRSVTARGLIRPRNELSVHMMYPYYYFWKEALLGTNIASKLRFPKCPVLYMVRFNLFRCIVLCCC